MKGANKFFAGILFGVTAGVALALFLKSDKGKEIMEKVKEGAEDLVDNIKSKCESFTSEAGNNNKEPAS